MVFVYGAEEKLKSPDSVKNYLWKNFILKLDIYGNYGIIGAWQGGKDKRKQKSQNEKTVAFLIFSTWLS